MHLGFSRGANLESLIEFTNKKYNDDGLCRVDKIATPVKVLELSGGVITKGYFEKKSTVDFVGIVQGVFVAFDAKETALKSLPLKNIHPHQVDFMNDVDAQGGLAFLIVHFTHFDDYFLVPLKILNRYYQNSAASCIPHSAMHECIEIELSPDGTLRYIDALNELVAMR